jgi:hypothetical protein
MKAFSCLVLMAMLVICGCSTTHTVSQMEGRGTKAVYNAPFDATWRAAVDAAQHGDLTIINADPSTGYISAKRGIHLESFGENVGIWVTRQGPAQTGVEVVSRQAGPPVLWIKNWEKRVQQAIAANLSREAVGNSAPPAGSVYGTTTTVPTYPAPPPPAYISPAPSSSTTGLQSQITTLQQQELSREQELQREQDSQRRAALQNEINLLKGDLQKLQQRLNQLEQEQRATTNP